MCSGCCAHALGHLCGEKTKRVQLVSPSSALLRPSNSKTRDPTSCSWHFLMVAGLWEISSLQHKWKWLASHLLRRRLPCRRKRHKIAPGLTLIQRKERGEKNNSVLFTALTLPGTLMWDYTEMISSTLSWRSEGNNALIFLFVYWIVPLMLA